MIGRAATGSIGNWKPRPIGASGIPAPPPRNPGRAAGPDGALVPVTIRTARWVLERTAIRYPVRWYQWETASDERMCPQCGAMQGRTWSEHQPIPAPPLHNNCRCQVRYLRTEWRVRYVSDWRLRWFTRQAWEWKRTGWK